MVRSGVLFLGALGGGGCGTSASKPLGVKGVITMKIMSSTSSTSMSGVTLMFALWPPLGPTAIVMVDSPLLPTRRSGGWSVWCTLPLLGEQAKIVDAGGAHCVHHLHYVAEVGAGICLDVHFLVCSIGKAVLHLAGQTIRGGLVGTEVDRPIAHHRNQQCIFLVGILHRRRIVYLRHIHADTFLQHGRDHHEDDQQHQHHVHHRRYIDVGVDVGA